MDDITHGIGQEQPMFVRRMRRFCENISTRYRVRPQVKAYESHQISLRRLSLR